MVKWRR